MRRLAVILATAVALTVVTACGEATAPPLCAWRYTKFRIDVTLDSTGHGHSTSVATDSVWTCPTSTWWR